MTLTPLQLADEACRRFLRYGRAAAEVAVDRVEIDQERFTEPQSSPVPVVCGLPADVVMADQIRRKATEWRKANRS